MTLGRGPLDPACGLGRALLDAAAGEEQDAQAVLRLGMALAAMSKYAQTQGMSSSSAMMTVFTVMPSSAASSAPMSKFITSPA